jgi:hypothetical protein
MLKNADLPRGRLLRVSSFDVDAGVELAVMNPAILRMGIGGRRRRGLRNAVAVDETRAPIDPMERVRAEGEN